MASNVLEFVLVSLLVASSFGRSDYSKSRHRRHGSQASGTAAESQSSWYDLFMSYVGWAFLAFLVLVVIGVALAGVLVAFKRKAKRRELAKKYRQDEERRRRQLQEEEQELAEQQQEEEYVEEEQQNEDEHKSNRSAAALEGTLKPKIQKNMATGAAAVPRQQPSTSTPKTKSHEKASGEPSSTNRKPATGSHRPSSEREEDEDGDEGDESRSHRPPEPDATTTETGSLYRQVCAQLDPTPSSSRTAQKSSIAVRV